MTFTFKSKITTNFKSNNMTLAVSKYGKITYVGTVLTVPITAHNIYKYDTKSRKWKRIHYAQVFNVTEAPSINLSDWTVYNALLFDCFEYYNVSTEKKTNYKNAYYRSLRERICFPIVNRGKAWYDRLTAVQETELNTWYDAWLNITETYIIPDTPTWVNDKLTESEDEIL